jgi:hypothetical protein
VEFFELSGRPLARLTARRARLYGATRLDGIRAHRITLFSSAVFGGRADLYSARFDDKTPCSKPRSRGSSAERVATQTDANGHTTFTYSLAGGLTAGQTMEACVRVLDLVFPAPAGVFPPQLLAGSRLLRLPRACGGVPETK